MGLKDLCEQVHRVYREDDLPKAQKDMYTTLPEMAMRPADAYECLVRGRVESNTPFGDSAVTGPQIAPRCPLKILTEKAKA